MGGKHRPGKGRISVAALTAPACTYTDRGLYCVKRSGHPDWHELAYPGTRNVRYLSTEMKVYINGPF